ncbi:uncharacterized protein B0H18DRAFT_975521, partial [Fomitopsis serialis]|uniref:uncharacterized protein n=1 Tax=Fomitopsis serialis TaxID=139415 RepID=UPI002008352B
PPKFPSPIGGVPNPHDLVPSVVFAVAYAITIPLAVYRLVSKSSRNVFIISTAVFAIERVIDFSFRAKEAETPSMRTTSFWVSWLQSAYAMGFIGLADDVGNIARVFLIKSTRGPSLNLLSPSGAERPALPKSKNSAAAFETMVMDARRDGMDVSEEVFVDEPMRRVWIERYGMVSLLMQNTALALGGVYAGVYFGGTTSHSKAVTAQRTRCVPSGVANPADGLRATQSIPALYRLAAMANYTDSLLSTAPGSLNGGTAKVFYTLHIAPEFIAGTLLLSVNVKKVYGFTGWRE